MDHERGWAARHAADMGKRVAEARKARGMTAQQVADECTKLGMPSLSRIVITKLENNRREAVSVAELLVLASVLEVPAIELMFPVGRPGLIEVLPGKWEAPWDALKDFTAEASYYTSAENLDADIPGLVSAVNLFRLHDQAVYTLQMVSRSIEDQRQEASTPAMESFLEDLRQATDQLMGRLVLVNQLRRIMKDKGLIPPPLPPDLARFNDEDLDGAH